MTEFLPNSEQERQAELLRQQQEQKEKYLLADLEKWREIEEQRRKEYDEKQRAIDEQTSLRRKVDERTGLHLRPDNRNPSGYISKELYEQLKQDAKREVEFRFNQMMNQERKLFLEAQQAERDKQTAQEQERADQEREAGTAHSQNNTPPRSLRPNRDPSLERYAVLHQEALKNAPDRQPARDEEMAERIERNRALLREAQEKERDRER